MVDHEPNPRVPLHRLERGRQLAGAHQDVVGQPGLPDRGDSALHVVAQQPSGIWLVMDLVPDADQKAAALAPFQTGDRFVHRPIGEVDPAHDAGDELVFRRGLEEPARLLQARYGLDHDRPVDPVGVEERLQV